MAPHRVLRIGAMTLLVVATAAVGRPMFAQDAAPRGTSPPEVAASSEGPAKPEALSLEQADIAEKFKRFEHVVKLLAQYSDSSNQEQARLLRQVFAESQARSMDAKFDALVRVLAERRLAQAATDQEAITEQLESLLAILLSADREKELKAEQARLREHLKKVKELINKQREIQGRTVQGDPKEQATDEARLAEDAAKLAKRMQPQSEKSPSSPSGKSKENAKPGDPSDGKPSADKPSDEATDPQNSSSEKPSDRESSQPSDGPPKSGQSPKSGKPSGAESQPGQDSPDGDPPSDADSPSDAPEKRVEAAQKRMEEARRKLEKAEREGAVEKQDEAIRELEQARAKLEEILRQLREEEMARMLAQLERRFAEMLQMQEAVYRDTRVLHDVPKPSRGKAEQIEAGRLSRDEALILVEADRAVDVLREEGSAVALPATCGQMREDIRQIVQLLAAGNVDELTLALEEDVIATLKEMLEALKKAQKDLKDNKQTPSGEGGDGGEQPLVDRIAELKMIRSLQLRVNRRTKLIAETAAKATDPETLQTLQALAEREQEVFRITRDIVLGKNK